MSRETINAVKKEVIDTIDNYKISIIETQRDSL